MKKIIASILSITTVFVFSMNVYAADSTVMISGNTAAGENQPGWMFNRDAATDTPFEFNSNEASLGAGSLYVLPIGANPADKFIGENFLNKPITEVNSISYDFLIGSGGVDTEEEHFYMNVYANFGVSDDNKFYDCRYNVVPTVGSTADFTTVTFDPNQAYPVTTRTGVSASPFTCPAVPADMDDLSPGSNIRAFALNVGDTSASDEGLDGYLDKVVVNLDSGITTYDFEPAPSQCSGMTLSNRITGTSGNDNLRGTSGNDLIFALGGEDRVDGGSGHDCVVGGPGNDRLDGGSGNDIVLGEAGLDRVDGGSGNDKLFGGDDNDTVDGGSGNDQAKGDDGDDNLEGGSGNDNLSGDTGANDRARGGSGTDTCSAETKNACEL